MRKRLLPLVAVLGLGTAVAMAAQDDVLRLAPLVREAVAANPVIEAARERHRARLEKVPQAGALEDPMLGFGVINIPGDLSFGAEDMTMKEISLSQKFPFPGKRGLNRKKAATEAAAAAAEIQVAANRVVQELKNAFYDLVHAYRVEEVTRRSKVLLEELSRITHTRYALGKGLQEDIVRIQVEISRMVDDLLMVAQQKEATAARLNGLLNRPPETPVPPPEDADFRPARFSVEALQQEAARTSPMLAALQRELDAQEQEVALARSDYLPDFNLRFAYGQRDEREDLYTGMVEMNLPVFFRSKQGRRVAEGQAAGRAAQARLDSARNDVYVMIAEAGSMARRLERKVTLFRTGIIPQARLQINTAISAYMVDKADFMTVLDSRMQLYRYELEYHDAVIAYEKSLAAMEALIGSELPREEEP